MSQGTSQGHETRTSGISSWLIGKTSRDQGSNQNKLEQGD